MNIDQIARQLQDFAHAPNRQAAFGSPVCSCPDGARPADAEGH